MECTDEGWIYDGKASSRLWAKSAIGLQLEQNSLLLSDSEALFCIAHRGIDIPQDDWLQSCIVKNSRLLQEFTVLEALRYPGNKIMLSKNVVKSGREADVRSWALRWGSDAHPDREEAVSEIRWFSSTDSFDKNDLFDWSKKVLESGRFCEILVVDDEHSVVTYRTMVCEPMGDLDSFSESDRRAISKMDYLTMENGGAFFPNTSQWPSEVVGIPLHSGRQLDSCEMSIIEDNDAVVSNRSNKTSSVLLDLWGRGLHARPGFKYGARWRCYAGEIGDQHAPWLVIGPDEAPDDWEGACLSSRLASGVNKQWIIPVRTGTEWSYLEVARPPPDSRWSNPNRN